MIKSFVAAMLLLWMPQTTVAPKTTIAPNTTLAAKAASGNTWTYKNLFYYDNTGAGTGGSTCTTGTSACTVTVSGIAVNDSLIACIIADNYGSTSGLSISSINGETWTNCTNCTAWIASAGSVACQYVLRVVTGSETSFTATLSGNTVSINAFFVVDASWSGPTVALDTSNSITSSSCSTACLGPALTLSGTADFGVAEATANSSIVSVNSPWSTLLKIYDANGMAPVINMATWTTPSWSQGSTAGSFASASLMLKGS
jgi:hypothetical protein